MLELTREWLMRWETANGCKTLLPDGCDGVQRSPRSDLVTFMH